METTTQKSLKGTKTEHNLMAAFAGESQARNRYTFYASVAKKEGYEQIAAMFLETADNEKEHAKRFFKFLEGTPVEINATYPTVYGDTLQTSKLLPGVKMKNGQFFILNLPILRRKKDFLK